MLENEARHYWKTAQSLRLKIRRGTPADRFDADLDEMAAMVLHSSFVSIRDRAADVFNETANAEIARLAGQTS